MSIELGQLLGPYRLESKLGEGGMGEVYRARDTRLDRTVAIKVIGSAMAGTPELRERFEREARAISQLNHPAICTLHDVGHDGDIAYLVLEHIEGESLAARLQRGAMPSQDALSIAIVICEALETAHRVGIIHRDLKPGNVMLLKGGRQAKLLDFGLAKLAPGASPAAAVEASLPATVTTPLTARGSIIGTFHYMAPEQLEGAEADARSDIWAFGCVLYEMLTGRRPFDGKTQATLISAVIASEPPPLTTVQPLVQPALDYTVRTCLAKNPEDRFQNAHDLLLQLRWVASAGSQAGMAAPVSAHRRWRTRLRIGAILAAAVLGTAVATWWLARRPVSRPAQVLRAEIVLPNGVSYNPSVTKNLALSPDGNRVAFSSIVGDDNRIMVRELSGMTGTPLIGTELGIAPFFSPDGQWIGFSSGGQLRKVPISGGSVVTICEGAAVFGAVWAPDDTIIYADPTTRGLMRVSASGGQPARLTTPQDGEVDHRWPSLLPGGGALLYAAGTTGSWSEASIVVHPLDGGTRSIVIRGGTAPQYLGSGHLAYVRAGTMYVVPFDARGRAIAGTPRPVVENVTYSDSDGRAHYVVSEAGTLMYLGASDTPLQRTLVWVSRDGKLDPLPVPQRGFEHPRISPNGRYIAVTLRGATSDIWLLDLSRMTLSRVTFDPGEDESAVWMPDSRVLTFSTSRAGKDRQTLAKAIDGSGGEEELFSTRRHQHLGSWTPDGSTLVTEEVDLNWNVYAVNRQRREWTLLTPRNFAAQGVQVSPDGHWIAYVSNEGGPQEVYVQALPGPGGKSQVSNGGGTEPRWSPAGDELFYRNGERMMAVKVRLTPTFTADTPRVLFEGHFSRMGWGQANYDVSTDGKRFLMIQGNDTTLPQSFRVVVNWIEELKSLAPAVR